MLIKTSTAALVARNNKIRIMVVFLFHGILAAGRLHHPEMGGGAVNFHGK
jgi:hypothetical protein